jgi:nucleotide-binding universal stress UspA family protein
MTYRNLLLLLDAGDRWATRTAIAIDLARKFECRVTGLAPTGIVNLPAAVGAASFAEVSTQAWDAVRTQAQTCCTSFESACRAAGFGSYEVQLEQDDHAAALVRYAAYHDLGIVGQIEPDADGYGGSREVVEQAVLYSPRPTLVIPYAGSFPSVGNNVLVAWDESREAARAVCDALPLLKRARKVSVFAWTEANDRESARRREFDRLLLWLRSHGVDAEARSEVAQIPIAAAIQSQAAESGADLVVMGAYGHARWRERTLGGATRGLLTSMTVPVLMSR